MSGRGTCQRTDLIDKLVRNKCVSEGVDLATFLKGLGGAKIKELFPEELANYSKSDIGNSLDTIKAQLSRAAAVNSNNHSAAAGGNLQQPPQFGQE